MGTAVTAFIGGAHGLRVNCILWNHSLRGLA